ncbi:MAG TPA: aldose 1-epimerase family protein [Nocardioidaceae bacterium]|nr:aldose 1-epimerase family protein [Nocardioidaceae bacterium]
MSIDVPSDGRLPSGDQHVIAHGGSRAHVTQVGATLRGYTVDGRDVIDGFGIDERARDGRGQVLAPWPNRLTDGSYRYGGHECQAPLNEPSRHDAIHGLVRWSDWSLVTHAPASVTLAYPVRPQPGYEWQLDLELTYELDDSGLTATFRASNVGTERAPFGVGFHPYLGLGATAIDGLDLTVPATTYLDPNGSGEQPTTVPVAATPLDFAQPRRIGTTRLDTAFGDLVRGDDGRAIAVLSDPTGDRSVQLWIDDGYRYLMVYTADLVSDPGRRRTAVAVEPMTCPPDALRTGTDLIELDPGQSWQSRWGLRPESSKAG